jgi:hypothetical protein
VAEAQLFSQGVRRIEHAIQIHRIDVVDAHIGWERAGRQINVSLVGTAQEALGQVAPGLRIDLVGTADRIDDRVSERRRS